MSASLKDFLLVLFSVVLGPQMAEGESINCLAPFPGPEIQYDFYACSIILDWNRHTIQDCSARDYEVQYLTDCNNDGLRNMSQGDPQSDGENFQLPGKIPGECIMNTSCYVRMRFRLTIDASWSKYTAWTTLSNNYEAFQSQWH